MSLHWPGVAGPGVRASTPHIQSTLLWQTSAPLSSSGYGGKLMWRPRSENPLNNEWPVIGRLMLAPAAAPSRQFKGMLLCDYVTI